MTDKELTKIKTVYNDYFYIDYKEYMNNKRNRIKIYYSTGKRRTKNCEYIWIHKENISMIYN